MRMFLTLSIFALLFLHNICVNTIREYFLQTGASGHCDVMINGTKSVFVKSHEGAGLFEGLSSYEANQNCEITYNAEAGMKILVQFSFFDLQPPALSVCLDSVQITELDVETTPSTQATTTVATITTELQNTTNANDTLANTTASTEGPTSTEASVTAPTSTEGTSEPSGVNATFWNTTEVCNVTADNETLCWNETESYIVFIPHTSTPSTVTAGPVSTVICESPGTYVSNSSSISIRFISDSSIQRGGFSLLLTSFHLGPCSASEFSCDTDRCISNQLKCDGVNHCVDGADESQQQAGCTSTESTESVGLSKYAVLGIAVLASGVVLTIFTSVVVWKYLDSGGKCKCGGEVEEDVERPPSPKKVEKPKKAVKIKVTEKTSAADVEESPRPKRVAKRKVEPLVVSDVDW